MQSSYKTNLLLTVLVGIVFICAMQARPPGAEPARNDTSERSNYEAITGESADEDKSVWDSFYRNKNKSFGTDPVSFLKDYLHLIPKGRAFVPAMGEGRNAIYLAKKGFVVDGNELSQVAMDRALGEAKQQKVSFKPIVADLNQYKIPDNTYDFILVSLFYSQELMPKFKKALKPGGYIMFYNRVEELGPKKRIADDTPSYFSVDPHELKSSLKDFDIKAFKEYTDQGVKVVGVLARKP